MIPTHNTTEINKPVIMTQLQDQFMMGHAIIRSVHCLYEMKKLVREGSSIAAEGKHHDDRPMAMAMGVRCWIDWERRELDAQGRTFEREEAQDAAMGETDDASPSYLQYVMGERARQRQVEQRAVQRTQRQGGRWQW